ncbi:MAG: hypothetical protein M3297_09255 [Thermoproteota archaeon]|nr:hypothetical protein [Thermoproteota archaeon]
MSSNDNKPYIESSLASSQWKCRFRICARDHKERLDRMKDDNVLTIINIINSKFFLMKG